MVEPLPEKVKRMAGIVAASMTCHNVSKDGWGVNEIKAHVGREVTLLTLILEFTKIAVFAPNTRPESTKLIPGILWFPPFL